MKKYFLAILILLAIPGALFASSYGKPYGSSDETATERSDVKTIDQLNRSTDFEELSEPVEQEPVLTESDPEPPVEELAPVENEPLPVEDSVPIENEQPSVDEQDTQTQ